MNKSQIIEISKGFIVDSEYNQVSTNISLSPNCDNMKIFEYPIFGFASARDVYFEGLKDPEAIGDHFMMPTEWMPEAQTVISFFLPFSDKIKAGNKRDMRMPSDEWLHGRIEGQKFIEMFCLFLKTELVNAGYASIVPSYESRFYSEVGKDAEGSDTGVYTSNWSERHIAFGCGLGTFGLSKGLITSKGMAGRFGSLITALSVEPDTRAYTDIYEYCTNCGKCAQNCPVNAISIERGKIHKPCSDFVDFTAEKYKPRYGCGKCQVNVPCESGIPRN